MVLADHIRRTGRSGDALIFGRTASQPFTATHIADRADEAWTAAELERATLHQLRHAHGSFLVAAGITIDRADRYMGHARNTVGDRYRHQLRGQLTSDAKLLDEYVAGKTAEVVTLSVTGAQTGARRAETA